MEIIVCVKRVPDTSEAELEVDRSARALEQEDLAWGINEWDNFAVETAVQLKEKHGGKVTAVTVGDEEAEEVLRRALAMGCDEALHLRDDLFEGLDAHGLAVALHKAIASRSCDLVLTGAVSGDESRGQVGGFLAALLDAPFVALATDLAVDGSTATARHEVEGGLERVVAVDLPAVISVQTGINEPRYVSIRGIRKVASMEIPVRGAADLGLDAAALASRVELEELFVPPRGEGAEMLEGSDEEMVEALLERLKERGGL